MGKTHGGSQPVKTPKTADFNTTSSQSRLRDKKLTHDSSVSQKILFCVDACRRRYSRWEYCSTRDRRTRSSQVWEKHRKRPLWSISCSIVKPSQQGKTKTTKKSSESSLKPFDELRCVTQIWAKPRRLFVSRGRLWTDEPGSKVCPQSETETRDGEKCRFQQGFTSLERNLFSLFEILKIKQVF